MAQADMQNRFELLRPHFSPEELERFGRFLQEAPEEELFRMSPLRYGLAHGLSDVRAVDLFLRATHAGLVDFTWGVLCPGCASFLVTPAALRSLRRTRDCLLCRLRFNLEDDGVEVAFTISPAVRRIRFHHPESLDLRTDLFTLLFSPSRVPPSFLQARMRTSALDQAIIPASGSHRFSLELPAGLYGVVAPSQHNWFHLQVSQAAPSSELEVEFFEGHCIPEHASLLPGPGALTVRNRTPNPVQLALCRMLFTAEEVEAFKRSNTLPNLVMKPYLGGKHLVMHQTFRELFRAASIPSEGGLEMRSVTILFTDLKGSTELYGRIGDLYAYDLVRQHFRVLHDIIASHGGSLVKTIGDAVMAAFAEPVPALEAAIQMRRDVGKVSFAGHHLLLKAGLNMGPCIAVELNDRLDYFGQTVNLAARVQAAAAANEITFTTPIMDAWGAMESLRDNGLQVTAEKSYLKGVDLPVNLWRAR